jgi:hypothetical protein
MNFNTTNTRTILLAELALAFRVDCMELPDDLSLLLLEGEQESACANGSTEQLAMMYGRLSSVCQEIFAQPSASVFTFLRWRSILEAVLNTISSERYQAELMETMGGNVEASRKQIREWLDGNTTHLLQLTSQFSNVVDFASAFLRNGILNSLFSPASAATNTAPIMRPLYWTLREQGIYESHLLGWRTICAYLTGTVFAGIKQAYEQLQEYEFPIPASGGIISVPLNELLKHTRAAALIMPGNIITFGNAVPYSESASPLALVIGGPVAALVIISVGCDTLTNRSLCAGQRRQAGLDLPVGALVGSR